MASKAQALSDEELLSAIDAAESAAIGNVQGTVAADRSDAIDRYLGRAYGDEQEGRSSVVSRDVADVVEGVLANVLKPFVSGDHLVQFDPIGPEDEEQAQQETDYINFVALERNNGFLVLNAAVKDALLLRNGYVKCGWTKRSDVILETYTGLSDEEAALLLQDKDVEIVGHAEYPDQYALPAPVQPGMAPAPAAPTMLHDVKMRRARPTEFVEIKPVPPDEILVSERATEPSVQDVDFVQHRVHLTLSEVRQMGYDVPDDINDDSMAESLEERARDRYDSGEMWNDPTQDAARRVVLFKETWMRIDRDGDGIAELRRICVIGSTLLADEETDIIPIACGTGTLMSHQHLGTSVYDMVQDLARLKTALIRQFMDNKYLANNGRHAVNENTVNFDDMMISRPGGIVRVNGAPGNEIMPLLTPDTGASALQGLEYLDSVRENRTGYTRYAQGMDSDSLVNKTATGLVQATNQSQLRLEMISRTIAETLLRDLFRIIHALTLKHSTKEEKVRLKNKWVVVNPREWVRRNDLQISVGLGSGSTDQQFGKLMGLNPLMQQAMQLGLAGPQEAYNYGAELLKSAGFKNPDKFIHAPQTDPQTGQPVQPPPQPDPLVQVEQIKQQGKQAELQHNAQLDMQKFQAQAVMAQREAQMKAALDEKATQNQMAQEQRQAEMQYQLKQQEMQNDKEIALYKAELEQQTAIRLKQMDIAAQTGMAEGEAVGKMNSDAGLQLMAEQKDLFAELRDIVAQLAQTHATPKRIVRDPVSGRAIGVVADRNLQ